MHKDKILGDSSFKLLSFLWYRKVFLCDKKCSARIALQRKGKRGVKMDYIKAFLVGGLICAAVQVLMEKTKLLPGRIMVLLVCSGAVLSFLGIYPTFVEFAGAGASVPLLGFGNVLMEGVKEAVDKEGFLGLFKGGFTAGAVGCSAALIFGYLASLITDSKMKD